MHTVGKASLCGDNFDGIVRPDVAELPEERVTMPRQPDIARFAWVGGAGNVADGELQRARITPRRPVSL